MSLRNKPCRCGSGLKTKKCCGERIAAPESCDCAIELSAVTVTFGSCDESSRDSRVTTFNGTPIYKIHGSPWLRTI